MPYEFYKYLHFLGLFTLFFAFGGVLISAYSGQTLTPAARKMAFILHGFGILIILVSGFGLAARLGLVGGLPGWIHAKLGIWLLLAAGIALAKRKGHIGWPLAVLIIGLGSAAGYIATNKPF